MKVRCLVILILFGYGAGLRAQSSQKAMKEYIEQYRWIAISEMQRTGIPASIKLAQALLESRWGTSQLARNGNNHFGIKCGDRWPGGRQFALDDDFDKQGNLINSCFRVYGSPEESFLAHSDFLMDPIKISRYGFLFNLDPTDYKAWAKGLKKAGYATDPNYHKKLISLIDDLKLDKYDKLSTKEIAIIEQRERPSERPVPPLPVLVPKEKPVPPVAVLVNNDVRYATVGSGETLRDLANRTDTPVRWLLKYNENLNSVGDKALPEGARVYLQPKRKSYRGKEKWHTVKPGESLLAISAQYAIDLEKLKTRNLIAGQVEPVKGEQIKLRGGKVKTAPKVRSIGLVSTAAREQAAPTPPATTSSASSPVPATIPAPELRDTQHIQFSPVVTAPPKPVDVAPASAEESPFAAPNTALPPPKPPTSSPAPAPEPIYHWVQPGETLWRIARQYNSSIEVVRSLNNLPGDTIKSGMRLRVK